MRVSVKCLNFNEVENIKKLLIKLIVLLLIPLYLSYQYTFVNGISMGKDGNVQFLMPYDKFFDSISVWEDDVANGTASLNGIARLSIAIFGVIFGPILGSFLYHLVLFFLSLYGMFNLAKYIISKFTKNANDVLCLLASVIYITHPITVSYKLADTIFGTMMAYFISPILIYLICQIFELTLIKNRVKMIFYIILLYIISLIYLPAIFAFHVMLLTISFAILLFFVTNFNIIEQIYKNKNTTVISEFFILLIIFLLLFSPIILITYFSSKEVLNIVTHEKPPIAYLISTYKKIPSYSIILTYPAYLWGGLTKYSHFFSTLPIILLYTFYITLIIFLVIWLRDKKGLILIMLYLLYTSFALCPKLCKYYITLFKNFPILWIYRVAYIKVATIQVILLSLLSTYVLHTLQKIKKILYNFLLLMTITVSVIFFLPILNGDNLQYHSKVNLNIFPYKELLVIKNLTNQNENSDCKILAYPSPYPLWIWTKFGYFGYDYLSYILMGNHITSNMESREVLQSLYFSLSEKPINITKVKNKLNLLGISYILYRKDLNITEQEKRYMGRYLLQQKNNWNKLKNGLNLSLIYKGKYYELYYIPNSTGPVYCLNKNLTIKYKRCSPSLWKVYINTSKPFLLVFAESYDPLWEVRVYKDGKLIEKVESIPIYSTINGFWINKTGNLKIVIRYIPQNWFDISLKISWLTFIMLLLYLSIYNTKIFKFLKNKIKLFKSSIGRILWLKRK